MQIVPQQIIDDLRGTNFDGYNWINEDDKIQVIGVTYKNPGEKVGGSELGDMYDIIVIGEDDDMPDRFQAILTSPIHYITRMINDGFDGIAYRMTTTSKAYVDAIYNEAIENCSEE
jgi:hypothetical protein